jgi:(E)-4-hydroxy-3-methylbut-2-enyl-diphosphate synthase
MGALLVDGIGDTMRVSLTADPVEEVKVAWRSSRRSACASAGRS